MNTSTFKILSWPSLGGRTRPKAPLFSSEQKVELLNYLSRTLGPTYCVIWWNTANPKLNGAIPAELAKNPRKSHKLYDLILRASLNQEILR